MTNLIDHTTDLNDHTTNSDEAAGSSDRRKAIRRLALGAIGATAGVVALSDTASAGDSAGGAIGGNALELGEGVTNTSATPTTLTSTGTDPLTTTSLLSVGAEAPNGTDGNNILPGALGGYGKGTVPNGVHGSTVSTKGVGVVAAHLAPAQASDADPLDAASTALLVASVGGPQIKFALLDGAVSGPTTGVHSAGEMYVDADGTLWFTVPTPAIEAAPDAEPPVDAVPAGVRFVKLAGSPTAGQFHVLPIAQRIYDSRNSDSPKPALDDTVNVDLTKNEDGEDSGFPPGATSAVLNIAIDSTEGKGFVRAFATGTDLSTVKNANINWSAPDLILSNQATIPADGTGKITYQIGGSPDAKAAVIFDLAGYFL